MSFEPSPGLCVLFNSHNVLLCPGVRLGTANNIWGGGGVLTCDGLASQPGRKAPRQ